MWLALATVVWAGEIQVGLRLGGQRIYASKLTTGWTVTADTPTKKCWKRGSVAEVCLSVSDRAGRAAQAIVDEQKAGLTMITCETPQTSSSGPVTSHFQACKVRETLQEQIRGWRVLTDATSVGVATFKLTAEDQAARADGDLFITSFAVVTPEAAKTRGTPICAALETVLGASVDRYASLKGPASPTASTLRWPGGTSTPEIVEKDGKVTWHANLGMMLDAPVAQTKLQALIDVLATCDTWCDQIAIAQSVNEPRRSEITWSRADAAHVAPRCADAKVRAVLQVIEDHNTSLDLFVDAP